MAVLYTPEEIQGVLKELRIKPVEGKVNGKEAARILTWRAKAEQGIDHAYPDSAIRRHVERGNLRIAERVSTRFNLYKVEDIFDLSLVPRRGVKDKPDQKAA